VHVTREERARILGGDHAALKRDTEPDCEPGEVLVLVWSRTRSQVLTERRFAGDVRPTYTETARYPRQPLVWIELQQKRRHRDGGWRVPIRYHDKRTSPRFLGPAGAPADEEQLSEEGARGYRSTAMGAIDHLEAVDDEELRRQNVTSRDNWAQHREEIAGEEEARQQERAVREQLKQVVRGLPPVAARALLATIERDIREALEDQSDAPHEPPDGRTIRRGRAR
jgi:hypothetical protein